MGSSALTLAKAWPHKRETKKLPVTVLVFDPVG